MSIIIIDCWFESSSASHRDGILNPNRIRH